jgi:hypothetical protein
MGRILSYPVNSGTRQSRGLVDLLDADVRLESGLNERVTLGFESAAAAAPGAERGPQDGWLVG